MTKKRFFNSHVMKRVFMKDFSPRSGTCTYAQTTSYSLCYMLLKFYRNLLDFFFRNLKKLNFLTQNRQIFMKILRKWWFLPKKCWNYSHQRAKTPAQTWILFACTKPKNDFFIVKRVLFSCLCGNCSVILLP